MLDDATRYLYFRRLTEKMCKNSININDTKEDMWLKLKYNILSAAGEAWGKDKRTDTAKTWK